MRLWLTDVAQWIESGLRTKGSMVQFVVRAHAWVAGQVSSTGYVRDNHILVFLSLSFSSSTLSKNEYIKFFFLKWDYMKYNEIMYNWLLAAAAPPPPVAETAFSTCSRAKCLGSGVSCLGSNPGSTNYYSWENYITILGLRVFCLFNEDDSSACLWELCRLTGDNNLFLIELCWLNEIGYMKFFFKK